MKKIIIAAVSENFVIGKEGNIPWHSESELSHFKKTTTNFPILMGRKTFTSLGSSLPNRANIVLSRDSDFNIRGSNSFLFKSISEVYDFCSKNNFTKLFIIGGGEIFFQLIDQVDELLISKMRFTIEGDTIFPKIDPIIWELYGSEEFEEFTIEKFRRC